MTAFVVALAFAAGSPAPAAPERTPDTADQPRFEANVNRLSPAVKRRITGSSWRPGCPVPRRRLRMVRASYWNFDREIRKGPLIVHRAQAREIVGALRDLFQARFPIRRMNLVDRYGADDRRSMAADNTSAFNCRFVAGTDRWSMHAYGKAIDVNPVENPYVTASGYVSPLEGARYADRSRNAKGMIHRGDDAYRAFRRAGWEWAGDWDWPKDFQHFSANGK